MAKERRSLFSRIFGSEKSNDIPTATTMTLLNGYQAVFTNYNGKIYDDVDVKSCVDAIARNGAKLVAKHIRKGSNGYENVHDTLERIVSEEPNELQNAYDFYYYILTELYVYNEAFIYISRDENFNVLGLYPIHAGNYKIIEYQKKLYLKFQFGNGKKHTASMRDVIHLKRFCGIDGMSGGTNTSIIEALSIKHVVDEGIVNAIKTTQSIRGIVKSTKALLKPEDVAEMRKQFVKDFIDNSDGNGIGGLDATTDFKEINLKPEIATDKQIEQISKKIYKYFGINENIIESKYSEEEWNAFYESVLEPIAIQMSQEFTNKIFTLGEKYHENKIVFTSNRLQYASNNTKISLVEKANNLMTIDELREVFNLEPLPDGKGQVIMQDLNHIDSDIANNYQVGDKKDGMD